MILFQIIVDLIGWAWEHREQITIFGIVNVVAIAIAKRVGMKQLKRLFGLEGDFKTYVANQQRIEMKVDSIMKQLDIKEMEGCVSSLNRSTPYSALKSKKSFISRWAGFITARPVRNSINLNGGNNMKTYFSKLGSRKFQAFLVATATNVIMLTGYLLNVENIQEIANEWMPAVNVAAQTIATLVYIWAQGKVDSGGDTIDYAQADTTNE